MKVPTAELKCSLVHDRMGPRRTATGTALAMVVSGARRRMGDNDGSLKGRVYLYICILHRHKEGYSYNSPNYIHVHTHTYINTSIMYTDIYTTSRCMYIHICTYNSYVNLRDPVREFNAVWVNLVHACLPYYTRGGCGMRRLGITRLAENIVCYT